jgi:hypothetical protein
MKNRTILEQMRRNAVALISLAVAITGLGYNTWRNEHSERNRNLRFAAFELLLKLGELEEIVFVNFWDCDTTLRGSPRTGWTLVRTIKDLGEVLNEEGMPENVLELESIWAAHWEAIDFDSRAQCMQLRGSELPADKEEWSTRAARALTIRDAIDVVRADTREVLFDLE